VVVGGDRPDHFVGLAGLLGEAATDEGMGPLDLVVHRLADVMQQCGAA
jgi:hypothetical protein